MLALVFDGKPELEEVPDPLPGEGQARLQVLLAGICGTDLELLAGYKGFRGIPGHEMVGIVEAASDPSWMGARVVCEINIACGTCSLCREGRRKHCERRRVLGLMGAAGAFAERVVVPLENLHRVPEHLTDEEAVWTEPLAAALAATEAGIGKGEPVLVLGDGRLGSLIALALQYRGAEVKVVGRVEEKLTVLESLGIAVERHCPQPIYPWVIEATGSPSGLGDGLAWTRPTGTLVLKSTCHDPALVDTSPIVVNELRLMGSRCGKFPPALEALASGRIPVKRLISKVFPLTRAVEALEVARRPEVLKILLEPRPRR